jgi:hypothetical protein
LRFALLLRGLLRLINCHDDVSRRRG